MLRIGIILICTLVNFLAYAQQRKQVITWHDEKNKIPKEIYYVISSAPTIADSLYSSYYNNGKLKTQGYYSRGKADGPWEYYYENGIIKMKGMYKDNKQSGHWYYFFESGKRNMDGEIINGEREHQWKFYYENEAIKSQGIYTKGVKEGIWSYYYEDGTAKAQATFKNDKGRYIEIYPNGSPKAEGDIVGGKSNGLWKYYHENGSIKAEGQERDGIKEGMWKFYHNNGGLMSEGAYIKGQTDGNWKYYYENGNVSSEGNEKQNRKDGYWKLYYKNGMFKGEGQFNSGEGIYKEFYESGKLKMEGMVAHEKNQGQWKYFYESGALEGDCFFTDGQGKFSGYYENGKLKMEGIIVNGNKSGIWKLYKEDGTLAGYYRTYYENDIEKFQIIPPSKTTADTTRKDSTIKYLKPHARLPKKKSRYFIPKINEFRSIILASNPLGLFFYRLPISIEYYFQERLGFEIGGQLYREPLFKTLEQVAPESLLNQGYAVYGRQKFYQPDQEIGMFYFGHEIRFSKYSYALQHSETNLISMTQSIKQLHMQEYLMEYSAIVGNRIMSDPKRKGLTADIFVGVGIGYRFRMTSWDDNNTSYNVLFADVMKNRVSVPIRFGIMIGYALGKSKLH